MTVPSGRTVLVAGIGNIFFGDDGFGPAVIRRLHPDRLPAGVEARDYGIRGVHLAYELLDGRYQSLVLVDALPMGEPAGTLAVIEVDGTAEFGDRIDAHTMTPAAVLAAANALGAPMPRVLIVGCQPAALDTGMVLSEPVTAALEEAAELTIATATAEASQPAQIEVA
jgi:hydrogenase maturation protease